MKIQCQNVEEYLQNVPQERQISMHTLRRTLLENIPQGFEECISYDMIGYVVPHAIYPKGYHCNPKLPLPFCHIASQKNFIALYHMGIYADPKLHDWFVKEYPKHSKYRLDMGKSCVRFKKPDQIPYALIAELIRRVSVEDWIALYTYHYTST